MPITRDGAIRVNDTEYDGIVIELLANWTGREPTWAVPPWEEWSRPDLAGPFATRADAERAIREHV